MRISDVLHTKGRGVVTATPTTTVTALLATLAEKGIGSIVISTDGSDLVGIVSERDVVRQLHASGPGVLDAPVSSLMTASVITCDRDAVLQDVARTMADNRVRHSRWSTPTASSTRSSASVTSSSTASTSCRPSGTS